MMPFSMSKRLIDCFENEFGELETGFKSSGDNSIQIVRYHSKKNTPQFISTLGLSSVVNDTGHSRFEWIMEFSRELPANNAASVVDHYLSMYLDGNLGKIHRGSYLQFPQRGDGIWKNDNSNGLYFTVPIFRSKEFQNSMASIGIIPIWVVPTTSSDVEILNYKGWQALEDHWDRNEVDLLTTFRI